MHASKTNTKDILGFYFLIKIWENKAINNEPDRHSAIEWFPVDNLPNDSTTHAQKALAGIKTEVRYSTD